MSGEGNRLFPHAMSMSRHIAKSENTTRKTADRDEEKEKDAMTLANSFTPSAAKFVSPNSGWFAGDWRCCEDARNAR